MKPLESMKPVLLLGTWLVTGILTMPTFAQPYQVVTKTVSPLSTGDTFSLVGTLGQPPPLIVSGGSYTLSEVFFGVAVTIQQPGVPELTITQAGQTIVISWPAPSVGFELEAKDSMGADVPWHPTGLLVVLVGNENTVTVPARAEPQFFRLSSP